MNVINSLKKLTRLEKAIWLTSVLVILVSYFVFKGGNLLNVLASLIGVTALIFVSKGDVLGQIITVIFSVFYGVISFKFHYYGEMITYMFMTAPMAVAAVVSWLKNPFNEDKSEVTVAPLKKKTLLWGIVLSVVVTVVFYFVLKHFNTKNLVVSTLSVTTSFLACYLTYCRSSYYALAYALNDVVLIILWTLATFYDFSYLSMVLCFLMFLLNDLYGFYNWQRILKRQKEFLEKI
jgi:nicotinamide mononucleotide transporter PnuC